MTEAKKLLEDSGLASDIITKVVDLKATRGQMRWNWNGTVGLGGKVADGGIIYYSNTGSQTIDIISPSLYASYSFGDVIKAYGEPEYILALGQYSYPEATVPLYSLSAVYLTKGFMINEINTGNKPANLNPNTLFAFDMFFIPS